MRDLLILVADVNIEKVIRKMLEQSKKLEISEIDYEIYIHPEHDPGCCTNSANYIRSFYQDCRHAMVIFDHEGCGRESKSPSELEISVYGELASAGWDDRAEVVIINPELENWFWSDSPHIESVLGWKKTTVPLRLSLQKRGRWLSGQPKPKKPKELVREVLKETGKPFSTSIYTQLAESVSFQRCRDAAFLRFVAVLQRWFPNEQNS